MSATEAAKPAHIGHLHDHNLCGPCLTLFRAERVMQEWKFRTDRRCCFCGFLGQTTSSCEFPFILSGLRCSFDIAGTVSPPPASPPEAA